MHCLWCGREEKPRIRLTDILKFTPVKEERLCSQCQTQCLALRLETTCEGCGRSMEQAKLCDDCVRWKVLYPDYPFHNEALYEYNAFMKEWMEKYKFQGDYRMRELFAAPLKERIAGLNDKGCMIVPVPISQNSMTVRGFNQVNGLLDAAQIPYVEVLTHIGTGPKQSTKNRKQRMISPQPFDILDEQKMCIEKQSILLVDDVYTTGRTLFHAAECLFANGAKQIQTLTLVR